MRSMTQLDWSLVKEAARSLGVREKALEKWWQRKSVPHKWRLPLIRKTKGKISAEAFESREPAE